MNLNIKSNGKSLCFSLKNNLRKLVVMIFVFACILILHNVSAKENTNPHVQNSNSDLDKYFLIDALTDISQQFQPLETNQNDFQVNGIKWINCHLNNSYKCLEVQFANDIDVALLKPKKAGEYCNLEGYFTIAKNTRIFVSSHDCTFGENSICDVNSLRFGNEFTLSQYSTFSDFVLGCKKFKISIF